MEYSHQQDLAGQPFVLRDFLDRFNNEGLIPVLLIESEIVPNSSARAREPSSLNVASSIVCRSFVFLGLIFFTWQSVPQGKRCRPNPIRDRKGWMRFVLTVALQRVYQMRHTSVTGLPPVPG
jgi:hypothetical protein